MKTAQELVEDFNSDISCLLIALVDAEASKPEEVETSMTITGNRISIKYPNLEKIFDAEGDLAKTCSLIKDGIERLSKRKRMSLDTCRVMCIPKNDRVELLIDVRVKSLKINVEGEYLEVGVIEDEGQIFLVRDGKIYKNIESVANAHILKKIS